MKRQDDEKSKYRKLFGNKNAEKWTFEDVEELLDKAYDIASTDKSYHFVALVCDELQITHTKLGQLLKRFPELQDSYDSLKQKCLRNCYDSATTSKTPQALLLNLKSNHGMTERMQTESIVRVEGFDITKILGFEEDDE